MSHSSFPELRTSRFVLRKIVPDDLDTVYAGLSNQQVVAHYGVSYSSLEATTRQMAWFDSLLLEGKGIARECVSSIVAYGFDSLGLHRIGAEVDLENQRSSKLLERVGFRFEGIRRGYELKGGNFLDLKNYSRLSTDSA